MDIQAYTPSRFATQLGFSQIVAGSPGTIRRMFGSLEDARNAWDLAMDLNFRTKYVDPKYEE